MGEELQRVDSVFALKMDVALWVIRGHSTAFIAKRVGREESEIKDWVQEIYREWVEYSLNVEGIKAREAARLEELERGVWEVLGPRKEWSRLLPRKGERRNTLRDMIASLLGIQARRAKLLGLDSERAMEIDNKYEGPFIQVNVVGENGLPAENLLGGNIRVKGIKVLERDRMEGESAPRIKGMVIKGLLPDGGGNNGHESLEESED